MIPLKRLKIFQTCCLKSTKKSRGYREPDYSIEGVFSDGFEHYPIRKKKQFTSYNEVKNYIIGTKFDELDKFFIFLEFIVDLFCFLSSKDRSMVDELGPDFTEVGLLTDIYGIYFDYKELEEQFSRIEERANYFLNILNHELITLENGDKIIVEKNVYASEVSQILSETSIEEAIKVLEYNHFANKGNVQRKKEILISLAGYLEPYLKEFSRPKELSDELKEIYNELKEVLRLNNKSKIIAFDMLSEMYNQGGLRHNNAKQYHLNMNDEELEQWYDNIYTSTLFVILSLEMGKNLSKLNELKKK